MLSGWKQIEEGGAGLDAAGQEKASSGSGQCQEGQALVRGWHLPGRLIAPTLFFIHNLLEVALAVAHQYRFLLIDAVAFAECILIHPKPQACYRIPPGLQGDAGDK